MLLKREAGARKEAETAATTEVRQEEGFCTSDLHSVCTKQLSKPFKTGDLYVLTLTGFLQWIPISQVRTFLKASEVLEATKVWQERDWLQRDFPECS